MCCKVLRLLWAWCRAVLKTVVFTLTWSSIKAGREKALHMLLICVMLCVMQCLQTGFLVAPPKRAACIEQTQCPLCPWNEESTGCKAEWGPAITHGHSVLLQLCDVSIMLTAALSISSGSCSLLGNPMLIELSHSLSLVCKTSVVPVRKILHLWFLLPNMSQLLALPVAEEGGECHIQAFLQGWGRLDGAGQYLLTTMCQRALHCWHDAALCATPVWMSKKHLACKHFVPWLTQVHRNDMELLSLLKKEYGGLECTRSCCVTIAARLFTLQMLGKLFLAVSCDASVSLSQVPSAMLSWEHALRNLVVTTRISWRPLARCLLLWESGWNCLLFGKFVASLVAQRFSVMMKTRHYVKHKRNQRYLDLLAKFFSVAAPDNLTMLFCFSPLKHSKRLMCMYGRKRDSTKAVCHTNSVTYFDFAKLTTSVDVNTHAYMKYSGRGMSPLHFLSWGAGFWSSLCCLWIQK